jgi:hypothetical protein
MGGGQFEVNIPEADLASSAGVREADPDEVEARLGNLSHGTNRDPRNPEYVPSS